MSRLAHNVRHLPRSERKARREAIDIEFEAGSARDARAWDEGFMEVAATRPTFTPVQGPVLPVLDGLLGAHSIRDILGTLAQLCEARAPSEYDLDTDFSDHAEGEMWSERANALFAAMEHLP